MSLQLPRLRLPASDANSRAIEDWALKLVGELDREARADAPAAKAAITLSNVPDATTTFDGSQPIDLGVVGTTIGPISIANFLAGVVNTLIARTILRTKAGSF